MTGKRQCIDDALEVGKSRKGVRVESVFRLGETSVVISSGSVVKFSGDAIVNAANNGGLGGGGVDGAVNAAGGKELIMAREALPIIKGNTRIPTGDAVVTIGGNLAAKKVIHAVGPNYMSYRNSNEADEKLRSAYQNSLRVAVEEEDISSVGFSLLSSGIFRGSRSLDAVLEIACVAVRDSIDSKSIHDLVKEIHLIAFNPDELKTLMKAAKRTFSEVPEPHPNPIAPSNDPSASPAASGRQVASEAEAEGAAAASAAASEANPAVGALASD